MKIIVEDGDVAYSGLQPGTYEFGVHRIDLNHSMPGRGQLGLRVAITLEGELGAYTPAPLGVFKVPMEVLDVLHPRGPIIVPHATPRIDSCDECGGSGEWENPANGRRSPCSRGCRRC